MLKFYARLKCYLWRALQLITEIYVLWHMSYDEAGIAGESLTLILMTNVTVEAIIIWTYYTLNTVHTTQVYLRSIALASLMIGLQFNVAMFRFSFLLILKSKVSVTLPSSHKRFYSNSFLRFSNLQDRVLATSKPFQSSLMYVGETRRPT
jgi:hypothetical protein